ncbi:probable arabinosyltransferase ARAD1 isoform X1 [Mangifera indica]|uniref:probable arabinosyltransferase ARAD1 isoform X1 n=2 Tax=Mangifera indica TaxID=29780 RepID=UPI001CFA7D3F|nr:probable arabinosyltransferase ARAD1 isoform X1 [Mangifera indica]XP_044477549.1 probable arabinosyltransferase ARAD1 isoform X1 [Mangifera indica]
MSEKSIFPSRFLFYLITILMFLLILSSVFLLESSSSSFIPRSVFKLILLNHTSVYLKPNIKSEQYELPFLSSAAKTPLNSGEVACHISSSEKEKIGSFGQQKGKNCDPSQALLRVYMYDLPPEFHFGLLGWKGKANETWPDVSLRSQIPPYPGGLNLQHSMEYWLTLDLLLSNTANLERPCSAIRVKNSSQADVIFVPFFSSLSYNRHSKIHGKEKISVNEMLQKKLVQFLKDQDEWKRLGGHDHIVVAHHPNGMVDARKKLGSAMFVLADFGRYPMEIANIEKDIIAPYMHLVRAIPSSESLPFEKRPTLVYFQGAIYRKDGGVIRQELYYLLKDEKDVHFAFGSIRGDGVKNAGQGMASSKFCLNIAGDTPSSNRLFDAIASHCVPVIISDEIELPYEDVLDYSEFCITVNSSNAIREGFLLNLLRGVKQDKWTKMWERLKEIVHYFEYQYPSQPGDAVDMIWQAVSRKASSIRFKIHRQKRYNRSQLMVNNDLNEESY